MSRKKCPKETGGCEWRPLLPPTFRDAAGFRAGGIVCTEGPDVPGP